MSPSPDDLTYDALVTTLYFASLEKGQSVLTVEEHLHLVTYVINKAEKLEVEGLPDLTSSKDKYRHLHMAWGMGKRSLLDFLRT